MSDKPFDTVKGAFLLVALVIGTQMLVILGTMAYCAGGILHGDIAVGSCKDLHDDIASLFQMSFTAAIAFAGGRMSAPSPPSPKLPPDKGAEP